MKILFAGTPEFAIPAIDALLNSKHAIRAVLTQPDRPAGRGQKLAPTAVKSFALKHNLKVIQPETLRDPNIENLLNSLDFEVLVDVACGLFLPKKILQMPKFGCINVHPSLLPRWRGAAPIQRAILAGDSTTGTTIMKMDEGLDTGNIIKQEICPIEKIDTTASLTAKLANLSAKLLLEVIDELELHSLTTTPQDEKLTIYAEKITKEEAHINWIEDTEIIDRKIRAFNPWPVAFTKLNEVIIRIWEAKPLTNVHFAAPGIIAEISKDKVIISTKNGALELTKIQLPGGKILDVKAVLNAHKNLFTIGTTLA
jgi:methionyl-tRNA formyltransferase